MLRSLLMTLLPSRRARIPDLLSLIKIMYATIAVILSEGSL